MSKNALNDVKKLVIKKHNKNPEIIEVLVVGLSGLEPAHLIRENKKTVLRTSARLSALDNLCYLVWLVYRGLANVPAKRQHGVAERTPTSPRYSKKFVIKT